jgi:hypothetical protein
MRHLHRNYPKNPQLGAVTPLLSRCTAGRCLSRLGVSGFRAIESGPFFLGQIDPRAHGSAQRVARAACGSDGDVGGAAVDDETVRFTCLCSSGACAGRNTRMHFAVLFSRMHVRRRWLRRRRAVPGRTRDPSRPWHANLWSGIHGGGGSKWRWTQRGKAWRWGEGSWGKDWALATSGQEARRQGEHGRRQG